MDVHPVRCGANRGDRRELGGEAVADARAFDDETREQVVVAGVERVAGTERDLELAQTVFGVQLQDRQPGRLEVVEERMDERLVLQQRTLPVGRSLVRGLGVARIPLANQRELDLEADPCLHPTGRQTFDRPSHGVPTAPEERRAIGPLHVGGSPREG